MIMQTTSRAPTCDREPSWSRLPPLPNPDLTGRNPGEQAVVVAAIRLRASRATTTTRSSCVLANRSSPSGCEPQATTVESVPIEAETTAGTSKNATAGPATKQD